MDQQELRVCVRWPYRLLDHLGLGSGRMPTQSSPVGRRPLRGSSSKIDLSRPTQTESFEKAWYELTAISSFGVARLTHHLSHTGGSTADNAASNGTMNRALTRHIAVKEGIVLSAEELQVGCGGHVTHLTGQ